MNKKMQWAVVFAVGIAFASTSWAQTQSVALPETAPGTLMKQWLAFCDAATPSKAWNEWNKANYSAQALQRFTADEITKIDSSDCKQQGGYRVEKIAESTQQKLSVVVTGRKTDLWQRLEIALQEENKIRGIGARGEDIPEDRLPKDLSDAAVAKEVKAAIAKLGPAGLASGIVYAVRGAEPIFTVTTGYADRSKKTVFTADTQFTLGSMGKMFTATAIGQLVDQGKVSFDDPVGKFFPNYSNKTVREKVTVGMLLSHTGGLGDFLVKRTPEMMKNGVKRASEFMPLYEKDEPRFEPGSSWGYSNAGLALAGAIVEKASGEDYPDYIRKHVFEPAGMKNSDPNNIPHSDPRMVTPYTHRGQQGPTDEWQEAEHDIGSPAGGAISTAADLVRFVDALRSGKLVSKATFAQLASPHGKTPWGAEYGYAMEIREVYGQKVVGHGGGFPGVNTHLFIFQNSPYTLITLSNQDPPAADYAAQLALSLMAEKAKRGK